MTRFLVVGLYADDNQRYAESVDATTAKQAEDAVVAQVASMEFGGELIVAAVIDEEKKEVVR